MASQLRPKSRILSRGKFPAVVVRSARGACCTFESTCGQPYQGRSTRYRLHSREKKAGKQQAGCGLKVGSKSESKLGAGVDDRCNYTNNPGTSFPIRRTKGEQCHVSEPVVVSQWAVRESKSRYLLRDHGYCFLPRPESDPPGYFRPFDLAANFKLHHHQCLLRQRQCSRKAWYGHPRPSVAYASLC